MSLTKSQIEHLAQFRYALRQFLRFSEKSARKAGVSPQQQQLLLVIKGMHDRNWANVNEIAERLQTSHHGAVALVTRAQNLGLVARTQSKEDRRVVQVSLTRTGEALIRRLAEQHKTELERVVHVLVRQLQELSRSAKSRMD